MARMIISHKSHLNQPDFETATKSNRMNQLSLLVVAIQHASRNQNSYQFIYILLFVVSVQLGCNHHCNEQRNHELRTSLCNNIES
jgi:hypothetical protein